MKTTYLTKNQEKLQLEWEKTMNRLQYQDELLLELLPEFKVANIQMNRN